MSFLFPAYLYGLALVALPLAIHFFNFQRARRVPFTNVAMLQTVKSVTHSRNKLKHLLVLLARMAFVAALALAFAQPFLPQPAQQAAEGGFASIYLDNSHSMQQQRDNRPLLEWGLAYAEALSQAFPASMRYQLLANELDGNLRYFGSAEQLQDKLATLGYASTARQLRQVYERQLDALSLQATPKGNAVFWISDFQRSNLPDLASLPLDTAQRLYLLPLSGNATANLYIDSVWLEQPFIRVQENVQLQVRVGNDGQDDVEGRVVKLFLGDRQVSSASVSLPAGGQETLSLNFAAEEAGALPGKISLEDYPITFDNDFHFVLQVAPRIRIASISGDAQPYVKEVYANEPFFEGRHFDVKSVDYAALAEADLLVISGVAQPDASLQAAVAKAVAKGASLALFPADRFGEEAYTALSGLPLRWAEGSARQELAAPDAQNPFFEGVFEQVGQQTGMPEAVRLMDWAGGEPLLRFKTGAPFLSVFRMGRGNVFVCASPLDEQASNFAQHAVFVPVMYKMALQSKKQSERLAYTFGEPQAVVPLPEGMPAQEVYRLAQGDWEMIPQQRVVEGELLLQVPASGLEAGCYEVRASKNRQRIGLLAFNYAQSESELGQYSAEELRQHFAASPNVQVFDQIDAELFAQSFKARHVARPLWRYFVALALVALLAEVLLLRFWKY
jgi:hypothetical protein